MSAVGHGELDWSVATRAFPGETESGDHYIVTRTSIGWLLSWVGVGNVEGVLRHADPAVSATDYITMRGGIVGYRLPDLQPAFLRLRDGDTLALATDGINGDFVEALSARQRPDVLAGYILDSYAKATDDALVLVARWRLPTLQQGGLSP